MLACIFNLWGYDDEFLLGKKKYALYVSSFTHTLLFWSVRTDEVLFFL